jgi:hypothetical protein
MRTNVLTQGRVDQVTIPYVVQLDNTAESTSRLLKGMTAFMLVDAKIC